MRARLAVLALLVASPLLDAAAPTSQVDVFVIERNKNKNLVQYSVRLDAACRPAGDEPLSCFWRMLEESPDATEDVGLFERTAYGIGDQECGADGVRVQLKAVPARAVTIRVAPQGGRCRAEAFTRIDGAEARLSRVYVFADETKLVPTVEYVDLFGHAPDGRAVTERLRND